MKKILKKQNGFALIYTLLFITLLLIAASATWLTGMADLRLSGRSSNSVEAYQLAQAAIDDGFVKYKSDIGTNLSRDDTYPTGTNACASSGPLVHRTIVNADNTLTELSTSYRLITTDIPPLTQTVNGVYDYKICTATSVTTIEGIGYYKGSKITLKAVVSHDADTRIYDSSVPPQQIGWNHPNDYLTIYQTGPSQ